MQFDDMLPPMISVLRRAELMLVMPDKFGPVTPERFEEMCGIYGLTEGQCGYLAEMLQEFANELKRTKGLELTKLSKEVISAALHRVESVSGVYMWDTEVIGAEHSG